MLQDKVVVRGSLSDSGALLLVISVGSTLPQINQRSRVFATLLYIGG